jgi:hypothetical protein
MRAGYRIHTEYDLHVMRAGAPQSVDRRDPFFECGQCPLVECVLAGLSR